MSNVEQYQLVDLAQELIERLSRIPVRHRFFLGITGNPAAGKSTLAEKLALLVNNKVDHELAIVVPMDGFHLENEILDNRKLRHLKGIPETFDANGFIDLLEILHTEYEKPIPCPVYDRNIHSPVAGGVIVQTWHKLIITEGNYLLLRKKPWESVRSLLDEVWFIEAPEDIIMNRLIERHMAGGMNITEARKKIESTDLPNARIIEETRKYADRIILSEDVQQ